MPELQVHQSVKALLDDFAREPSHAILLTGQVGVGLHTIALDLAHRITEPVYINQVVPDDGKSGISIDSIKQLYAHTKVKDPHPRIIVIDDADLMSLEAQNSLLKLLEEPSAHVHFILTSHSPQLLLATIHSRVQSIALRPVDAATNAAFLETLKISDETRKRQIAFIAEGRPAEMVRLATDDEYFASKSAKATDARAFLGAPTYERLVMAGKYSSRDDALEFLDMLGRFAIHTLYRQPDSASSHRLDATAQCIERISANGNVKTQLMRLVAKWA